jgi:hypothetical protein
MKSVQTVSLLMAFISLLVAAGAAFIIWGTTMAPTQKSPDLGPSKIAEGITASSSCENLQRICPHVAAGYDALVNASQYSNRQATKFFSDVTIGALVWGLFCAAGFLYIFAVVRKSSEAPR